MALVAKRSRRTVILIIVLLVVVVGGLGYLVLPKLFSSTTDTSGSAALPVRDLKIVDNFGEAVLSDPRFTTLRTYGEPFVNPPTTSPVDLNFPGRQNPFAPLL